jgi:hypothetical protein
MTIIFKFLSTVLLSIFFLKGYIELFSIWPEILNVVALALIMVLFTASVILNTNRKLIHIVNFLYILVAVIISGKINGFSNYDIFFYLRTLILPGYLFYLFVYNSNESVRNYVYRLIVFFFAIQIPASWIKLFVFGGPEIEDYIGTVSMYQGSMTTLIAGIGTSYSFSKYLYTRKNKYLLVLFLFIVFSQIGGKRMVLFLVPLVMLVQFYIYSRQKKLDVFRYLQIVPLVLLFLMLLIYFVVKLNPSFNKEEIVWGSFDLEYVVSFVFDYSVRDLNQFDMSRNEAILYFIELMSSQSISKIIFGFGSGLLLDYKFTESSGVTELFDVRYGGRMAFVWILLQTGFFGVLTFFNFFIGFVKRIVKSTYHGYDKLAFYGIYIVVLIDIIFYSMSSLQYFSIMGTLLGYSAYIDRKVDLV